MGDASASPFFKKRRNVQMKLVESILTKNPCYTAGRKITVKGLMLHSVGCNQPKASVFINSWNSPSYDRACVHGFIDANDGTVYQTRGTTGDGTAAPAAGEAATTPTSVWRCVSRPASNIPEAAALPVLILQQPGSVWSAPTRPPWSCLPCCADSIP